MSVTMHLELASSANAVTPMTSVSVSPLATMAPLVISTAISLPPETVETVTALPVVALRVCLPKSNVRDLETETVSVASRSNVTVAPFGAASTADCKES